ncbi:MAG: hypothetical protein ACJ764_14015 [Solirubrobacteraceae bacterium]
MKRVVPAAIAVSAALLAACGTTTMTAGIGATLGTGSLRVTVDRFDPHPPMPPSDVTGLSRPAPGNRLVAGHVHLCTNIGPAIGTWDFSVALSGGGRGTPNNVATNYPQRFDSLRTGCSVGWIVFQVPQESRPTSIDFAFDDTGDSAGAHPTRGETHVRFSWTIAAR